MKKVVKIASTVIVVILALLITLPWAFQGKIAELVKTEGNKMLNAEFDFRKLNISLIKHFPQASLSLKDFWLKGQGAFAEDTLVSAGEVTATVNLFSLFGDSGYDISRIYIDNTQLHAIVLEDGQVNWDVMKSDTTETESEVQDTTASSFRIKLQRVEFSDINLIYDDREADMYAEIKGLDLNCKGDFSAERSILQLQTQIEALTYQTGGIPLLNRAKIEANLNVDADFASGKYTLAKNSLSLNAIQANIDGGVSILSDGSMDIDLVLNTNDIGFKELLSLIPAIYAKNFEELQTEGTATLTASAKGVLQGDSIVPAFNVDLQVKDGTFRYPSLPAGAEQIQISANVTNPGGSLDEMVITIDPFSFNLGDNPFVLTAIVKTPLSDPDFQVEANGTLDLGMIEQVYPIEDMELNGVIQANMNAAGCLSYIEKGQYDRVSAGGTVRLSNMTLKMTDLPEMTIQNSQLSFTPQYLNLSETTVKIGDNDITANSRFENYMGYVLKGSTLKGTLNVSSNYMNLSDFMSSETTTDDTTATTDEAETTTETISLLVVPANIDFTMQANMKKVMFDTMEFDNINGKLVIRNGAVDMKNLSLNTMGGNVVLNGSYSTTDPANPTLTAGFSMTDMSFSETYKELNMVRGLAPIFENLNGNFSGSLNLQTALDQTMSPLLDSLEAEGSLSTKDLNLSGVTAIDAIADAVGKDELKNLSVKDLSIDFTVKDGRISTKPFDIKMGDYTLNLSGTTGLDQTIDYSGKVNLPASAGKIAEFTTFDIKIGGTFTSPSVTIDAASMANQVLQSAGEKALEKLTEKLSDQNTTTTEESSEKKSVVNKVLDIFKKKD